jgi:ABC-2 type transport system ATP-binding protein
MLLEVSNLSVGYGGAPAIVDVSIAVEAGEVVAVIGPNGAGKSTLMKIVVGILRPTSGSVSVSGHDIIRDPEKAKKVVGYLPENPSLYTGLTVSEFLRFVGKIRAVEDAPLEQRIAESLKTFSLEEKTDALLGSLSKGMKQKVALIASAIHDPQVLVMDEPLTALDPKTQIFVNNWILSQGKSGRTVLLSTHNLEIVQDYATQIAIIDRGSIIAVGDLQTLRKMADAGKDARLDEVFLKLTEESS